MKKNSSHQYVHFHITAFNGNLFFFEMLFKIYNDIIYNFKFITTAPSTRYCFKCLRLYLKNHFTKITLKKLILFGHT